MTWTLKASPLLTLLAGVSACISEKSLGEPTELVEDTSTSRSPGPGESTGGPSASDGSSTQSAETDSCTTQACASACDLAQDAEGCEFYVLGHPLAEQDTQGIWISNLSPDIDALVELEGIEPGMRQGALIESQVVPAGSSVVWQIPDEMIPGATTSFLEAGRFVVLRSEAPVAVVWDAPLMDGPSADAKALAPTRALVEGLSVDASSRSIRVLATQDNTVLEWMPSVQTDGNGLPVPPVEPGEEENIVLNRGDVLQLFPAADDQVLTGTLLSADGPIVCAGCR